MSVLAPLFADEDRNIKIYKELVKDVNLRELWARARKGGHWEKNYPKGDDLVAKIVLLTLEIEAFVGNEVTSNAIAQIGDWDDQKIAFFQNAGIKQRASIAAIDKLVSDFGRELQI